MPCGGSSPPFGTSDFEGLGDFGQSLFLWQIGLGVYIGVYGKNYSESLHSLSLMVWGKVSIPHGRGNILVTEGGVVLWVESLPI